LTVNITAETCDDIVAFLDVKGIPAQPPTPRNSRGSTSDAFVQGVGAYFIVKIKTSAQAQQSLWERPMGTEIDDAPPQQMDDPDFRNSVIDMLVLKD
jgi:hypothetical protein